MPDETPDQFWSLQRCKDSYLDYLSSKRDEIEEQKTARAYYNGKQLTRAQVEALKKRGMAPSIQNALKKKINGIVGTMERLRRDPKAFPRTPKHEQGAELATHTLNYELDEEDWTTHSSDSVMHAAIDGIGGVELELKQSEHSQQQAQTDRPDYDVGFNLVNPADFFYDPRTCKLDFSDSRYMGIGKWYTLEDAIDLYPDKRAELESGARDDEELSSQPEKDRKWFEVDSRGNVNNVRICEVWYKKAGKWYWIIFTGTDKLFGGEGYFFDGRGKHICRYVMFAGVRDDDGDAYSPVRDLKGAQDEINAWNIAIMFDVQSKRLIIKGDAPQNLEKIRKEWARKDGTVILPQGADAIVDDKRQDIQGAILARENASQFIDRTALPPELAGEGKSGQSGRAISLLQQAGMVELGPFIVQHKNWKIRLYRALWAAIQRYWTAERWVRVTDDEQVAQFVQVNAMQVDPNTGMPTLTNVLGELDVDIIIDEGPDYVNAMQDVFETMSDMARNGAPIPPQALIEVSPLPMKTKQKLLEQLQPQPDPGLEQAQQIELQKMQVEIQKIVAETELTRAKTAETGQKTALMPDEFQRDTISQAAHLAQKAEQARQPRQAA